MRSDSFASLTNRPGFGPPPITYTRPPSAATPSPWRGVGRSASRRQRRRSDVVGVNGAHRSARCLASDRDDGLADRRRARAAARLRHRRLASPPLLAGRPRLDEREVRVQARDAARDRVDPPARGGDGEMLARLRAGERPPAVVTRVVGEHRARVAAVAHAADDVDDSAKRSRSGGGTRRRHRQRLPAVAVEHERAALGTVAAEDVQRSARDRRGSVVHARGKIGPAPPRIRRRRVEVDLAASCPRRRGNRRRRRSRGRTPSTRPRSGDGNGAHHLRWASAKKDTENSFEAPTT